MSLINNCTPFSSVCNKYIYNNKKKCENNSLPQRSSGEPNNNNNNNKKCENNSLPQRSLGEPNNNNNKKKCENNSLPQRSLGEPN